MIKEIKIEDQAIADQLAEFYELQNQIKTLSDQLKNMESKYKNFSAQLAPMFETMKELKEKTAVAKSFIIEIEQEGYERKTHKFKKAYEYALSKLNEATRAVCKAKEEEESTVSNIATRFSIKPIAEANMFDKAKMYINKVVGFFTKKTEKNFASIDKANDYLAKLASKAESKSTSNPLDEQGVITKTSPDVVRLQATINKTPSLKTSGQYINTRAELVDAIPSVIATFGKELQSNKISLGTILSDIKKGLVKAGYK